MKRELMKEGLGYDGDVRDDKNEDEEGKEGDKE